MVELLGRPDNQRVYPETSLEDEWNRQAQILTRLFAQKLQLSWGDYMSSLPQFPREFSSSGELHLTLPLIVETRIPWPELAKMAKIHVSMI